MKIPAAAFLLPFTFSMKTGGKYDAVPVTNYELTRELISPQLSLLFESNTDSRYDPDFDWKQVMFNALRHSPADVCFFCAAGYREIPFSLIHKMWTPNLNTDAVIPRYSDGRLVPDFGFYHSRMQFALQSVLDQADVTVEDVLQLADVRWFPMMDGLKLPVSM